MIRGLSGNWKWVVVGAAVWVGGCNQNPPQEQGARELPVGPKVIRPPVQNPTPSAPANIPTTPIFLLKPRTLGPVTPAVVALPAHMAEPVIRVRISAESDVAPTVRKGNYRGRVEVVRTAAGKYAAVNVLPMESYLAGVLSKELYGSWDEEAYRAQAVAARTFALYQILANGREHPWDVNGDETSQMYGGIGGESKKARAAIAATRGRVLITTWRSQTGIFCAFYSACTGGATQGPWEAWGDLPVGPLAGRTVGTIESNCPKYRWPVMGISKTALTRALQSWGQRNGIGFLSAMGMIRSAMVSKRNPETGRPMEILLTDVGGRRGIIRAEEFRLALLTEPTGTAPKPPSSYCDLQDAGGEILLVNGRGYGHGIGMSQWGAQALALRGETGARILEFYYPGSAIAKAW